MDEVKDFEKTVTEQTVYDIDDVPIFKAGKWNGDDYTEKDIDNIVESFNEIGAQMKPYVKLGHEGNQVLLQKSGMPAAGWVTRLSRVGDELRAKFSSVPKKIKDLIDAKAYGRISSEIFWNLKNGDKTYPKVLKAVALLGGTTPAVTSLDDFINLYNDKEYNGELHTYYGDDKMDDNKHLELELKIKEYEIAIAEKEKQFESVRAELDAEKDKSEKLAIEKRQSEIKAYLDSKLSEGKIVPAQIDNFMSISMSDEKHFESVKSIIESSAKIVDLGEKSHNVEPEKKVYSNSADDDEEKLDNEIKKYMKDNSEASYKVAMLKVLEMKGRS